ncbi:MAG: hypothetical protein PHO37_16610 [Kiritimatiellae bacterium]|nr:hypothetical protein [Kiritimatiellia bacterium]
MRATAGGMRVISLRGVVSRIATDLLAPHLSGARQPIGWQAEAVGRLAVPAPAKRKWSAMRAVSCQAVDHQRAPAVTARGYSATRCARDAPAE